MDEQEHVQELAWRRILKCRSNSSMERSKFVVPKVFFDAEHCYVMIDWQATTIRKPLVTRCLSNATIESYVKSQMLPLGLFPEFSCHTQVVERAVKLVTEASCALWTLLKEMATSSQNCNQGKRCYSLTQRKTLFFMQTTSNQF